MLLLNKAVQHSFVREFAKNALFVMQIWTWQKKNGAVCEVWKDLDNHQYRMRLSSGFRKHFCETLGSLYKKQDWISKFFSRQIGEKRLRMTHYKLQFDQAFKTDDKQKYN